MYCEYLSGMHLHFYFFPFDYSPTPAGAFLQHRFLPKAKGVDVPLAHSTMTSFDSKQQEEGLAPAPSIWASPHPEISRHIAVCMAMIVANLLITRQFIQDLITTPSIVLFVLLKLSAWCLGSYVLWSHWKLQRSYRRTSATGHDWHGAPLLAISALVIYRQGKIDMASLTYQADACFWVGYWLEWWTGILVSIFSLFGCTQGPDSPTPPDQHVKPPPPENKQDLFLECLREKGPAKQKAFFENLMEQDLEWVKNRLLSIAENANDEDSFLKSLRERSSIDQWLFLHDLSGLDLEWVQKRILAHVEEHQVSPTPPANQRVKPLPSTTA